MPSFALGDYGPRLLLQSVQVDATRVALHFPDHNLPVGLVDGDEVDLIASVFLPVVGDKVIKSRLAVKPRYRRL